MHRRLSVLILTCTIFVIFAPTGAHAFGAGDIPDFSYLNGKAFRHGDIEGVLENLVKSAAGAASGGGLLGLASSVLSAAKGGEKFSPMDVKRVYFGNWLRDYSQAMDIAGLSAASAETIVMILSVLGFMTFGFATEEFEITEDRLSVYLPVEHIDNPKGYAEKEGDARQFHPKLRPPVDPRELEIDERTGMKNYMATEHQGWDTSTAHLRRTFRACIEHGRRAQGREGADLWEAYRLLGTGLHTLEDLLAHSNWCEIALRKMGHAEVFCHVGENVIIETPNGPAPPLVTGTFGSADFIHSLLGEATDHISETSVTNLFDKMKQSGDADNSISGLKDILSKLPIGGGSDKAEEAEDIKRKTIDIDPDDIAPKEVQEQLLQLLRWRDGVYRDIVEKIEMVPGLNELIDQLTNALNAYIYTIMAPLLTPIMQNVTGALNQGSKAVIDSDDQYQVFDDPNASDPSHSILSKDHFSLILNEPAGKIAQVVVENTVNLIVQTWSDDENPDRAIDEILEAFHHPYYDTGNSQVQNAMMDQMQRWFGGLGGTEGQEILQALTKESVREGKNKRSGDDGSGELGAQPRYSQRPQTQSSGYGSQAQSGYSGGGYGGYQSNTQYSIGTSQYSRRNDDNADRYGQDRQSYGGRQEEPEYSNGYSHRGDEESVSRREESYAGRQGAYDNSSDNYSSRRDEDSYGRRQQSYETREERDDYGRSTNTESYRSDTGYGRQSADDGYGSGGYGRESHGRERRNESSYDNSGDSYNTGRSDEYGGYGHQVQRHQEAESDYQREGYQPSYDRPGHGRDGNEYERREGYEDAYGRNDEYNQPPARGYSGFGGFDEPPRRPPGEYDEGREGYGNEETFGAERLNLEDQGEEYSTGGYGGGSSRRRSPPRRDDYY
ncbi:hypothetical protein ACEPAG_518 [Sanghuangporus baumii]